MGTLEPMCGTQREFCRRASASTPLSGRVTRGKRQTLEGRKQKGSRPNETGRDRNPGRHSGPNVAPQ